MSSSNNLQLFTHRLFRTQLRKCENVLFDSDVLHNLNIDNLSIRPTLLHVTHLICNADLYENRYRK